MNNMLIQEEQELLGTVATNIFLTGEGLGWSHAILDIRIIGRMVEQGLNFYDSENMKTNKVILNSSASSKAIRKLHELTNAHPGYAKWNTAVFTLQQDAKYKIEYKWDQSLEDKVNQAKNG
jgi:hypothetical protein